MKTKSILMMVCISAATLAFGKGPGGGRGGQMWASPAVMEKLNLTDAQKEQFRAERFEMQKSQIQLRNDKALAEVDLRAALAQIPLDKKKIGPLKEKIANLEAKQARMRIDHLVVFLEKLTPEQHKVFLEFQDQRWTGKGKPGKKRGSPGKGPGVGQGMGPCGSPGMAPCGQGMGRGMGQGREMGPGAAAPADSQN